ncbi:ubiquitin carboxyl-terminal hydrolase [Chlorella sorokiniana]|uniref:Ubiquitin carboxyl-terminal hydrolase n=1 Tax=Chlorella sorokiniana TaxID=3076 RepID=A0A2P6TV42_CHLSO|nr:ubiquitin carboxyl-terminal hydrolase [Chlorella sorokiniana]|eukprot:PRW57916.1 ubiquitin carboxyl-terminal hydrolase [Chlorella sorokiniana]
MAPKKAPRAGLKAGGAGQGAQKPSEGLRDVAAAYTRFRKSPASLKVLKKAAAAHPSGLAELCLAKAALLQGVQAAIKDESAADGEAALLAGAHEALEHLVTAAVEHHSLAGLNHCLFLLDRGLLGLPGWRLRQAQRARLLEGWSAEGLSAQGAAGFQQLGQDVIESELWLKDMVYTWKDGRLQDTDARQVAEDYQQMASHVAKVARQEGAMSYDAAAVEARHRELEAVAMLDSDEDEEVPSKLTIAAPLSLRLLHFEYLPKSEGKALLDWVQKQREEEQQEQRQRQRQQQQQNRDAEVPAGRLLEASAAQLAARKRAQQLADFLKQQLRVECDGKDVPASNSEAATQQHGVAALLRLASLPLPDFRRLLADTADGGSAAEPGAAAAGTAGAAVEHAIQLLASGGPAPVQFELPAPLQQQQGLPLQAPPSPGSGGGGSSRQQFQWLLEQLLSHPETLADCKRQLFEELPELRYVLGSSQRPPEVSAALPSEYMVAGLGLPPSPDAIMPEEHWLDAYERDVNALRGPYWREDVLRAQTELGRSSVAAGPEAAGRIEIYELDCCEIKSNRASRCFDPLCADLLFFGSEVTGLSLSAAAHNTADILSMIGQRDMWQSKTEVCLKHVLLGHALIEVVLQQQERQRGAQSEETLSRIVPEGKQRLRGMQACVGAMASARDARGIALSMEAGNLVLQLLPLPDELLSLNAAGTGCISVSMPHLRQLRRMVLRRILAGLRHLASQGHLYRHPFLQRAIHYVNVGLQGDSRLPLVQPGSERWAPWNRLGVAPLSELLVMHGTMAAYFAREYAAGPAALGQEFQDAVAHALSSVQLLHSPLPPAGGSQGGAGEGEAAQDGAAPAPEPVLALSRLGLANAVRSATTVLPTPPAERSTASPLQVMRKSVCHTISTAASLPPAALPSPDHCALSLALCAMRVPALGAALKELRGGSTGNGAASALTQLRRLQLWHNLTLHAYHGTTDLLEAHQQKMIKRCARLMQVLDQPAGQASKQSLADLLCGADDEPGLLRELAGCCRDAGFAFAHECADLRQLMCAQDAWMWHSVMLQLRVLLKEARAQVKSLSNGSTARRNLAKFADGVTLLAKQAVARRKIDAQEQVATLNSSRGALQYVRLAEPDVRSDWLQLAQCGDVLFKLRSSLEQTDGSEAAVRAVLGERKNELRSLLLDAQTTLQDRVQDFLHSRLRMFCMADLTLRSEMSMFATRLCMHSPLEPLAQQLVECALPRKWAQQMEGQQQAAQHEAAAGLLDLGAPPSGQPPAGEEQAAAAAQDSQQQQAVDMQEQQRQAAEEQQRQEAAAAAAAAVCLLEEEEQQVEKQAKERQRKQQAKKQAAQQRAAAAAAAAAAKRKVAEEEAAAAAAVDAAARQELEREAEQRRQAQLEEDQRRQGQLIHERLVEQTRREAELLNRQRQAAEQRRQQQEAEQRRQQQEAEQRRQQQEAEQRRQQQEAEQRRQEEEAEQRRRQQAQEQAQAEQQGQAKAGQQPQQQNDAVGRAERPPARFVSWTGAWVCECGQRNETIKEHCRRCNARDPCLRWFQGICEERSKPCRLPHLWFDLPAERPKREQLEPGVCMAWPHPDFIYKRKPRASTSATKPSMPAAAAWQQPAAAAPDAEEAELAAAIQASLADAAAVASRHQAGAWQELPAAPRSSGGAAGGAQDAEALALAGLRNEAGEYNCFLNVVVQCLWRCAEFRQQVAGWDASFQARDPVLAALHALFAQLEQQEAARSSAAARGGNGGGRLPPVDPAPLREALAALPGQGFSLGEMNDAAELLLCVYEKVMEAEGPSGRANELAATFGLAVREEVHCAACGKTTHQNAYTQYFYNTQATTLQMARLVADGAASMGALLRDAEAQHRKSCDTDMSGCGALNSVNHFLQGAPRVFTLQVAWETHAPDQDMVAGTLAALDATVDLGEVYQGVERGLHRYALRSMVCYYGQHYQALVLVPEAGGWLMFDDTRVTRVGSWADVRRKCEAGRIQPSVLFYEAVA